jgi:hypothetical protein
MNNRNAICWCGSGKKYKRCHLEIDAAHVEALPTNHYVEAIRKNGPRRAGSFPLAAVLGAMALQAPMRRGRG